MIAAPRRILRQIALTAATVAGIAPSAWGQLVTASWLQPVSGNWIDASKWSTDPFYPYHYVPFGTEYDALIAPDGAGAFELHLGDDTIVTNLIVDHPQATLNQTANFLLVREGIQLNAGTVIHNGGQFHVYAPSTIGAGGTLRLESGVDTYNTVHSSGDILLSGGNWTSARHEQTGGSMHVTGGAFSTSDWVQTGGTFDMSGGSVDLKVSVDQTDVAAFLSAGNLSTRTFTIAGPTGSFAQTGGRHVSNGLTLNGGAGYHMNGGTLEVLGALKVGWGSEGAFVLTGGTMSRADYTILSVGVVDHQAVGVGTCIIDGSAGTTVVPAPGSDIFHVIGLGTGALGTMTVRNGAVANLGEAHIGITGGAGTLIVESGANVTMRHLYVGIGSFLFPGGPQSAAPGTGTFILSGSDSRVTITNGNNRTGVIGGTSTTFAGPAAVFLNDGTFTAGGLFQIGGVDSFVRIAGASTQFQTLWISRGTLYFDAGSLNAGTIQFPAATGGPRGKIKLSEGNDKTLRTTFVGMVAGASIDLSDNRMIIDYPAASPISTIRGYIATGYAGGAWIEAGITSSAATDNPGFALGYAEATSVFGSFPATFGGYEVDDTSVLIMYTRYGDANLDGVVNLADFNRLAGNFGQSGRFWQHGDFNYDGVVNLADFNLLAGQFGLSASADDGPTPQDWADLMARVPEPSGAAVAVLTTAALLRRRRA